MVSFRYGDIEAPERKEFVTWGEYTTSKAGKPMSGDFFGTTYWVYACAVFPFLMTSYRFHILTFASLSFSYGR